ncbi:hypothetical protein [Siccirubricoccus soli]|uniref:hypothetical protein n=1 Tax=Siccirubricoccus soli TaxID=2899147 RepID=UPI0035164FB5
MRQHMARDAAEERLAQRAVGVCAPATGWATGVSVMLAVATVVLWNSIYLDSSAPTAGTVQAVDRHLRGATRGTRGSLPKACPNLADGQDRLGGQAM